MKFKHKFALGLLMLAAIVAIVATVLIYLKKKNQANEICPASSSQSPSAPEGTKTSVADSWKVFQNTKYGFQITFSDVWQGYQAKENSSLPDQALYRLDFTLKGDVVPLSVVVYERSVWDTLPENTRRFTEVARNDDYVFVYSTWESTPAAFSTLTEKEIANVLKTFKLTK